MTVGVCFDHGQDPYAVGQAKAQRFNVRLERLGIDFHPTRAIKMRLHSRLQCLRGMVGRQATGSGTPAAKFSNRVYSRINASSNSPVGPLRCLAIMIFALPCTSISCGLYTSSR